MPRRRSSQQRDRQRAHRGAPTQERPDHHAGSGLDPASVIPSSAPPRGMGSGLTMPLLEGVQTLAGQRGSDAQCARLVLLIIDAGIAPVELLTNFSTPAGFVSRGFQHWM